MKVGKLVVLLILVLGVYLAGAPVVGAADTLPPLRVFGNKLVDPDGNPVRLRGVNTPSLEWTKSGINLSQAHYNYIANEWGANVVRVPINQDWALTDDGYLALLDSVVQWTKNARLYVIFDLHRYNGSQQPLPNDGSAAMWSMLSARWSSETHIIYDVYNEPADVPWNDWKMWAERLVDVIRSHDPDAVCVVGAPSYSLDFRSMAAEPIMRSNIVLSVHAYPYQTADWNEYWGHLSRNYPILVGEWGGADNDTDWARSLRDYMNAKWLGYTAWAFFPGGDGFPSLIRDWNYEPTAVGQIVRADLLAGPGEPPSRLGAADRLARKARLSLPSPGTLDGPGWRFFPETGHFLAAGFYNYWAYNGGLGVFGYPMTEEYSHTGAEGSQVPAQFFERQRFEYHQENAGTAYDVLLGRLGVEFLESDGRNWQSFPKATAYSAHYYAATGHAIAPEFWDYWGSHGLDFGDPGVSEAESLALFGYPISEPAMELNSSGDMVLTQWFERARFEYHPNNQPSERVQLGRLGAELLE